MVLPKVIKWAACHDYSGVGWQNAEPHPYCYVTAAQQPRARLLGRSFYVCQAGAGLVSSPLRILKTRRARYHLSLRLSSLFDFFVGSSPKRWAT